MAGGKEREGKDKELIDSKNSSKAVDSYFDE